MGVTVLEKKAGSLEQNENRHGIQTLSKGFTFSLLLLHIKKYTKISGLKKKF